MTDLHPAAARGFSTAEFEMRTEAAQRIMARLDLDAMLLTTEPEVRYFTGFDTIFWLSPTRPWFVVIPASGAPIAVIPEIGGPSMALTWISDIRTWLAPQPEDDGISLLSETLREVMPKGGTLGLPMGHETHVRMPAADLQRLQAGLNGITLTDATEVVRSQRMVKSEAEIAKIARMCSIASAAFEDLPKHIKAGDTERQAFAKFKIDLLQKGADDVPYLVGSSGPGGFEDVINRPSDRVIAEGDMLLLDTGALYDGYSCDFDRNFAFGHASDAAKSAYDLAWCATEAGLKAARPGITTTDLWGVMAQMLEEGGCSGHQIGRMGHGLGMQVTEWPSLMPGDETLIEAGMVLTLEPGLAFGDGKMMLHEENIVIREDGAELLTRRAAREFPIIT
ncbi:metallopeptidase, family M24 [Roseobacter sp. SK209-2-6]|uniref:M24 family metallopeptidase n=1 Tax=Roseobacter sp. SK209-2-6 TaxID=388739 RepID=UPI0000F3F5C4|nr:Xaa-Pro peptidase family protein [Roseobacter sp. SK209-2-6]EBA18037.1 metallopeptidase, family M24 [Roseobacter sp. SK209-2-6]